MTDSSSQQSGLTFQSHESPTVVTYHAKRTMKFYPISKRELDHIGAVNGVTSWCYGFGMLFLGLIGGCFWGYVQSRSSATSAESGFMMACVLFAVISFSLGCYFQRHRKSELQEILAEADDGDS